MSEAAPIKVTRHPSERRRFRPLPIACGCSCCCCCCLHTVGSVVGALWASRVSRPPPVVMGGAPAASPAAGGPDPLSPPARKVLGAFAVYWAAGRMLDEGRLGEDVFRTLGLAVRDLAQGVWDQLCPGRRPEVLAWIKARIGMLVDEGLIPIASVGHFEKVLAGAAPVGTGEVGGRGGLYQLYRVHQLFLEVAAAVEAGAVPVESLGLVRRKTVEQALQAAAQMGAFTGSTVAGRFSGPVLDEARGVLAGIPAAAAARAGIEEVLAGRGAPAVAPGAKAEGCCPICGEPLFAWPVVRCMVCETPHHEGCWSYNKRCATFACGSMETLDGAGRPGKPLPPEVPRFDLREGPARETESRPEARAITVFWILFAVTSVLAAASAGPSGAGLIGLALGAPVLMLGVALVVGFGSLLFAGPGGGRAFTAMARIGGWTILGSLGGIAAMVALWFLFTGGR